MVILILHSMHVPFLIIKRTPEKELPSESVLFCAVNCGRALLNVRLNISIAQVVPTHRV